MKLRSFFFALFSVVTLASPYSVPLKIVSDNITEGNSTPLLAVRDDHGIYRHLDLESRIIEREATLSDLTFYLHTTKNIDSPIHIKNNEVNTIVASGFFVPDRLTVFLIHGWVNNHRSPVNTLISEAILKYYDVNLFIVDWGGLAFKGYFTAANAVEPLGIFIGNFVNAIAKEYNKSYKDFIMIGHSLGAHIAGVAGQVVAEKIDHIVGMDPAGPSFNSKNLTGRLDSSDADFVQIIHTNAGFLGKKDQMGHADYYPNGGEVQPGCALDITGSCSHARSYEYYADSIKNEVRQYFAYKCDSYKHYQKGSCSNQENLSVMGRLLTDKSARGRYYLQTTSKKPYAKTTLLDIV